MSIELLSDMDNENLVSPKIAKIQNILSGYAKPGESVNYAVKVRYFIKMGPIAETIMDKVVDAAVSVAGPGAAGAALAAKKQGVEGLLGITENHLMVLT